MGFPGSSVGQESACSAGDLDSIPGVGTIPWEWNGKPLQYSCLENPMDRGAWWATVHGVVEFSTTERLTHTCLTYEIYKPFSHGPCNLIQTITV